MSFDPLEGLDPKELLAGALGADRNAGVDPSPAELEEERHVREEIAKHLPEVEVLSLLGRGGMGYVYEVRQTRLGRTAALKVLAPRFLEQANLAERFEREAQALARLSHPNIVSVYDFGRIGELCWLLMEKVDGTNLRRLLDGDDLTPGLALTIVPPLCEALQYAHDQGVVHRDVKPENILVDRRGNVKIADFGLAKLIGEEVALVGLTGSQQVLGTLRYMAPEQLDKPLEVDHRADIYSLGVVFYEMLTGEIPMGRFEPPSARSQADPRLDEVVLRTLEREPARRYQHVSEVKTEVESFEQRVAAGAHVQGSTGQGLTGRRLCKLALASPLFLAVAIPVAVAILFLSFERMEFEGRALDRLVRELDQLQEKIARTPQTIDVAQGLRANPEYTDLVQNIASDQNRLDQLTELHADRHRLVERIEQARETLANTPPSIADGNGRVVLENPDYRALVEEEPLLTARLKRQQRSYIEHVEFHRIWTLLSVMTIGLIASVVACWTGWVALQRIRVSWPSLYGVTGAMIGAWFLPVVLGGALSMGTILLGLNLAGVDPPAAFLGLVVSLHLGGALLFLIWWRSRYLAQFGVRA